MSISVMILEPQNDFEEHFFLPVATESSDSFILDTCLA